MASLVVYVSITGIRLDCVACGASLEFQPVEARVFRYWFDCHQQPRVAVFYAVGQGTSRWSGAPPELVTCASD